MATCCSILAGIIPRTEEPGGLQSMRSQRVGPEDRDFSSGPVVWTSPSNAGVWVRSLVRYLRSHVPPGQKTKTEDRNNIVTNTIKTLKTAHIKEEEEEEETQGNFLSLLLTLPNPHLFTLMRTKPEADV